MGVPTWLNEWSIAGTALLGAARFAWSRLKPPAERRPFWLLRLWDWFNTIKDRELDNQYLASQLRRRDALIERLLSDRERESGIDWSTESRDGGGTIRRTSPKTKRSSARSGATSESGRISGGSKTSSANSTAGGRDV